jgi:hypothetical protein
MPPQNGLVERKKQDLVRDGSDDAQRAYDSEKVPG